jgi:hypothetical protein
MSTIARIGFADPSPRTVARITGFLYLATIVTGIFAQGFVAERLIESGDAAKTAANILTNPSLYRLGFTVYLIEMTCQMAMTALFYDLLKPVSKPLSRIAAILGLAGCVIKTMSRVFFYAPLFALGGAHYLSSFTADQLQSISLLLLRINDAGAGMALAFFGFSTLVQGYLMLKATFFPRILGLLAVVGGVGWLAYLSPPLGALVFPVAALVGLVGSLVTIVYLLVKGVNEERWKAEAVASSSSIWR